MGLPVPDAVTLTHYTRLRVKFIMFYIDNNEIVINITTACAMDVPSPYDPYWVEPPRFR